MSNKSIKHKLVSEIKRIKPTHYVNSERDSDDLYPFTFLNFNVV